MSRQANLILDYLITKVPPALHSYLKRLIMNGGDRSGVRFGRPTLSGLQAVNQMRISSSTLTHVSVSHHLHQHPLQLFKRPSSELINKSQKVFPKRERTQVHGKLRQKQSNWSCLQLSQTPSLTLKQSLHFGQLIFKTQWWREGSELDHSSWSSLLFWYICTSFKCYHWILGHAGVGGGWHK